MNAEHLAARLAETRQAVAGLADDRARELRHSALDAMSMYVDLLRQATPQADRAAA